MLFDAINCFEPYHEKSDLYVVRVSNHSVGPEILSEIFL